MNKPSKRVRPKGLKKPEPAVQSQCITAFHSNGVLLHFFSFLPPALLARCELVCRAWRELIRENSDSLWSNICKSFNLFPREGIEQQLMEKAQRKSYRINPYKSFYAKSRKHICRVCTGLTRRTSTLVPGRLGVLTPVCHQCSNTNRELATFIASDCLSIFKLQRQHLVGIPVHKRFCGGHERRYVDVVAVAERVHGPEMVRWKTAYSEGQFKHKGPVVLADV